MKHKQTNKQTHEHTKGHKIKTELKQEMTQPTQNGGVCTYSGGRYRRLGRGHPKNKMPDQHHVFFFNFRPFRGEGSYQATIPSPKTTYAYSFLYKRFTHQFLDKTNQGLFLRRNTLYETAQHNVFNIWPFHVGGGGAEQPSPPQKCHTNSYNKTVLTRIPRYKQGMWRGPFSDMPYVLLYKLFLLYTTS